VVRLSEDGRSHRARSDAEIGARRQGSGGQDCFSAKGSAVSTTSGC
jgi:hypothetical protein